MNTHALSVYLNDHLAGATAGVTVLAALASRPAIGMPAKILHDEIEEDRRELQRIIASLKVEESAARKAVGWISEKLTEAKTRVDDPSSGALHEFELLEIISVGVHGKRALWLALQAIAAGIPALQTVNFGRLIDRADDQRERLESLRLAAAERALA